MPTFPGFAVFYGAFFGIGVGFSYLPPILSGWSYYPERKGMVSGIIVGAFAFGAAIFDQIAGALVNPENKSADIKVKKNTHSSLLF